MTAPIPEFKMSGGGGGVLPPRKTAAPVDVVGLARIGSATVASMGAPAARTAGPGPSLAEAANRMFDDDAPLPVADAVPATVSAPLPSQASNGAPIAAFNIRRPTVPAAPVPPAAPVQATRTSRPVATLESLEGRTMTLAQLRLATRNLDEVVSQPAQPAQPANPRRPLSTVDAAFDEGPATGPVATDVVLAQRGASLAARMFLRR